MTNELPAYPAGRGRAMATRLRNLKSKIDAQIAQHEKALEHLDRAMELGLVESDRRTDLHTRLDTLAAKNRRRR